MTLLLLLVLLLLPQDIAAVRDAVLAAAGDAWQGVRAATVDVMSYQYGQEVRPQCTSQTLAVLQHTNNSDLNKLPGILYFIYHRLIYLIKHCNLSFSAIC